MKTVQKHRLELSKFAFGAGSGVAPQMELLQPAIANVDTEDTGTDTEMMTSEPAEAATSVTGVTGVYSTARHSQAPSRSQR